MTIFCEKSGTEKGIALASFVRQRPDYGVPGERPIHLEEANSFLLREAKAVAHFRV
jgi:hypothetical protein